MMARLSSSHRLSSSLIPHWCQWLLTVVCLIPGGYTGCFLWRCANVNSGPNYFTFLATNHQPSSYMFLWRKSTQTLETLNTLQKKRREKKVVEECGMEGCGWERCGREGKGVEGKGGVWKGREGKKKGKKPCITLAPWFSFYLPTLRWGRCGFCIPVRALLSL